MDRKENFIQNYLNNGFNGKQSISGPGSDLENTVTLRKKLITLLNQMNIKILIDAPCGDFWWMQHILPKTSIEKYIGIDIVPKLIEQVNNHYGTDKIIFKCQDIAEEFNEQGDLVICRDCLVHLSFESALKVLTNFANSSVKYFLITTFDREKNYDYPDGTSHYLMDLTKSPFNLPKPTVSINEECPEWNGIYNDKSLGFWTREEINDVVSRKNT